MQFLSNETVQAICRTLFHSLWQGLLLAIAGGAVVLLTKKLRAAVRYNILAALLVVFAAGVAGTFCYQLSSITSKAAAAETVQINAVMDARNFAAIEQQMAAQKPASLNAVVINWLTANAGTIVFAWLLIIAFRCVQMLIGLRGIYILRHKAVTEPGEYWNNRLKQLAGDIQLSKPVRLMQSAIAKVPMVTGHVKPIILLPLGVLTALPQDEIEAILLHELAHIRRKDYLVNMLQNLCEIIFFFNPAVLWISSLIKDERENCCDDIAIGTVKNKKQFIHALISFQEYNLAASNYAVGFPGRKDHLLNRVKRIVTNNNKTLNNMEKTLLATGIVILSFITIAFAHTKQKQAPVKKEAATQNNTAGVTQDSAAVENIASGDAMPPENIDDTTKHKTTHSTFSNYTFSNNTTDDGNHSTINTTYEGREYRIIQDNDTVTALYVDGEKIPHDKISTYQPVIDKVNEAQRQFAIQQEQFRHQQEEFRQQQEGFRRQQEEFRQQQDSLRNGSFRVLQEETRRRQEEFRQQQEQMRKLQEQMRLQQDSLRNGTFKHQQEEFRQQEEQMRRQQEQMRRQQDSLRNSMFRQQLEQTRAQQEQWRKQQEQFREQERQFREQQKRFRDSGETFFVPPIEPIAPMPPMTLAEPMAPVPPMEPVAPVAPMEPMAPIAPAAPYGYVSQSGFLHHPRPPVAPSDNKTIKAIIRELKAAGAVTDEKNLSFSLTGTGLTVNGAKQTDALFEKMKTEFLKSRKDYVTYVSSNDGHSIHSDIAIN